MFFRPTFVNEVLVEAIRLPALRSRNNSVSTKIRSKGTSAHLFPLVEKSSVEDFRERSVPRKVAKELGRKFGHDFACIRVLRTCTSNREEREPYPRGPCCHRQHFLVRHTRSSVAAQLTALAPKRLSETCSSNATVWARYLFCKRRTHPVSYRDE